VKEMIDATTNVVMAETETKIRSIGIATSGSGSRGGGEAKRPIIPKLNRTNEGKVPRAVTINTGRIDFFTNAFTAIG
jgi:hypothetical protein